jgi:hypothetical protein
MLILVFEQWPMYLLKVLVSEVNQVLSFKLWILVHHRLVLSFATGIALDVRMGSYDYLTSNLI